MVVSWELSVQSQREGELKSSIYSPVRRRPVALGELYVFPFGGFQLGTVSLSEAW